MTGWTRALQRFNRFFNRTFRQKVVGNWKSFVKHALIFAVFDIVFLQNKVWSRRAEPIQLWIQKELVQNVGLNEPSPVSISLSHFSLSSHQFLSPSFSLSSLSLSLFQIRQTCLSDLSVFPSLFLSFFLLQISLTCSSAGSGARGMSSSCTHSI